MYHMVCLWVFAIVWKSRCSALLVFPELGFGLAALDE